LKLQNDEDKKAIDDSITKSLDSWTYTTKNSLMYVPDGVALTLEEQLQKSKSSRIINHSNTRFNEKMLESLQKTSSSSSSMSTPSQNDSFNKLNPCFNVVAKIGIDGKEANKETPKIKGN
jgi:hypothetical protein